MNEHAMWVRPKGALGWGGRRYLAVRLPAVEPWVWVGFVVRNDRRGRSWRWALTVMHDPQAKTNPPTGTAATMREAMGFVELALCASGRQFELALLREQRQRR